MEWLTKWAVILEQYDHSHISQKAIKGQALVDFLADHHVPNDWERNDDLLGEEFFFVHVLSHWEMFFDGAARQDGAWARVVLISPEKHILPCSFVLVNLCSNSVAKYQELILGLQMAIGMGIQDLDVYGDS